MKAPATQRRRLIITTGDVSDVDGFYALAAYAQSGSDASS
jgi:hypothetical protein